MMLMNPNPIIYFRALYLIATFVACFMFSVPQAVYAASEKRKVPALTQQTIKKLVKAQKLIEGEKPRRAIKLLNKYMDVKKKLNGFEIAQVANMLGYIYYSEDRFGMAISSFKKVIQQKNIPITLENGTRYQLSQLYYAEERYAESLTSLNRWVRDTKSENAKAFSQLGRIYYQLEMYESAISPLKRAISLMETSDGIAKEDWYSLLRIVYYKMEDYRNVVDVLETLVKNYPKKEYWLQLSEIYGRIGDEPTRLSTLDTAYLQGYVDTENRLLALAGLYIDFNLPFKAAKVIEKGLLEKKIENTASNLNFLANAWFQSQEVDKSISAMSRAAVLSGKGRIYAALTSIYLEDERYEEAIASAKEAINKGELKNPGLVWLDMGRAFFGLNRYKEATNSFEHALHEGSSKKYATQWISYVDSERVRKESLKKLID